MFNLLVSRLMRGEGPDTGVHVHVYFGRKARDPLGHTNQSTHSYHVVPFRILYRP